MGKMVQNDPWPTELKVDKDRGLLTIGFDDGADFSLSAELLRVSMGAAPLASIEEEGGPRSAEGEDVGELELAGGTAPRYEDALALLRKEFADTDELQYRARQVVERMALLLQGGLLMRHGDPAVADAFTASRLAGDWGVAFGTLPRGLDTARVLERARIAD